MLTEPLFQVGEVVYLKADPTRTGPVIEILTPGPRYRVFHSVTQIAEYYGEQLATSSSISKGDPLREALAGGQFLSPGEFLARLTAARLAHPLTDTLYAMTSARIQFIPFQFKPLLRFLRSDRPRLLIADEVGVGKTIEAGIILKELRARQQLNNVLIICPKALVGKWRSELRRFDERFHILDSSQLKHCLRETRLEGEWPEEYRKIILPLEILRREEYLQGHPQDPRQPGLAQLQPAPSFDLMVLDEAHHVRNPATAGHRVLRLLSELASAAVFLSATPVHVGSKNLFALLHLLRPDLFPTMDVFTEMMEPASHLLQAARLARANGPDWPETVYQQLQAAAGTRWGRNALQADPLFQEWLGSLQRKRGLRDRERVRCLRDLEEFHPLAGVLNRTRRRDVGRFTLREPHTVAVEFSGPQQIFYEQLIEFRRQWLLSQYDPTVVRLILDTLERQAASCLPALAATLDRLIEGQFLSLAQVADDEEEEETDRRLEGGIRNALGALRTQAGLVIDCPDPKFLRFQQLVEQSLQADGPGKVLVFSFFLNTLEFLRRKLQELGLRVEQITGRVAEADRELLRERFALPKDDPRALDILLSSEVGCEGLDYQFCDRMINYDIPWNPMRIEQRIGRIDRFGQQSEKVYIFNFITPGTVEERIFFRCFERLGVFHDTLGDLEGVLGELTTELSHISLDGRLSTAQQDEKTQQLADNTLRRVEEERRLEEESQLLLGLGDQLDQDLDVYTRHGRLVAPEQLYLLVQLYLQQHHPGCSLSPTEKSGLCRLQVGRRENSLTLQAALQCMEAGDAVQNFRKLLEPGHKRELTFQQGLATARRDVEFITPVHPLARLAMRSWESAPSALAGCLRLPSGAALPGPYLFLLELWESVGARNEVLLVGQAYNMRTGAEDEGISERLVALLSQAQAEPCEVVLPAGWEEGYAALEARLAERRRVRLAELRTRNEVLVERQLASLDAYIRNRLAQIDQELAQVSEDRVVRMKGAERLRVEGDYAVKRADLLKRREAEILATRLAAGVLV